MKTTKVCPICHVQFTRIHTTYKTPNYCSRGCANKAPGRMTEDIKARIGMKGPNHPNYKGGWKARGGKGTREYFFVWLDQKERAKHPTTNRRGYIHRSHYVWNNAHPRDKVKAGEIVHHINGESLDDGIENLCKVKSQSEHMKLHAADLAASRKRTDKGTFI